MNSDESEFQEVLVDVPKRDKDGNPISFDSLGPGGARNDDGTIKVQYKNPRRPKLADELRADEPRERRAAQARRRGRRASLVKEVRWDAWNNTKEGDKAVRIAIRKVLVRHGLPASGELFDRAYAYVAENY